MNLKRKLSAKRGQVGVYGGGVRKGLLLTDGWAEVRGSGENRIIRHKINGGRDTEFGFLSVNGFYLLFVFFVCWSDKNGGKDSRTPLRPDKSFTTFTDCL